MATSPRLTRARTIIGLGAALALIPMGSVGAQASPPAGGALTTLTVPLTRTGEVNGFTVSRTRGLTTITWRTSKPLPTGDARPEFVVGDTVVGAPVPTSDGSTLVLRRTGLGAITPSDLGTVLAGRRIDDAGLVTTAQDRTNGKAAGGPSAVPRPTAVLATDPGKPGRFATRRFSYRLPGLKIAGLPHRVETLATVVAPTNAPGRRPVVLLLHGRHTVCYLGTGDSMEWPCTNGSKPIPSQNGYLYLQKLLATQGYVTVSIAANGINAQDDSLPDSGASARSTLVRHHLDVLAGWNRGTGPRNAGSSLKGHLDMGKVMLVGHSRGGEGVNRAAIDTRSTDPYRIAGQVLIAPTDFGRQVAPGVPTTVLLPYCDGDVSDLQGQQYVDQGRTISSGDNALRTAVLVMGANHNYFNTEWTPGDAAAPADDDWYDQSDPVCGKSAPGRLSAKQQRAAGAAYVAAAAQTYLSGSTSAVKLLDGTPVRAASAGRAVALTEAVGGRRTSLVAAESGVTSRTSGRTSAFVCTGYVAPTFGPDGSDGEPGASMDGHGSAPACLTDDSTSSPHWPTDRVLPSPTALRVGWTAVGGGVTVPTGSGRATNIATATAVDLRVAVDTAIRTPKFDVVLTDSAGHSQTLRPVRAATALPTTGNGSHLWAQTVRVNLPKTTSVDRTRIVSMTLRPTSRTGRVYLLDAYASRSGLATSTVSVQNLPRVDVRNTKVTTGVSPDGIRTVLAVLPITGSVRTTSSVWVNTASMSDGFTTGHAYPLSPGQRRLEVPVDVIADGTWSVDPVQYQVSVVPLRDAYSGSYLNTLDVASSVPPPTLTVIDADNDVTAGQTIRWTLRLSTPVRGWFSTPLQFVTPKTGDEATTDQLLRSWVKQRLAAPLDVNGRPAPLSASGPQWSADFTDLSTTVVVELPTAVSSAVTTDRQVQVEVAPDGAILTEPLTLTATIHP